MYSARLRGVAAGQSGRRTPEKTGASHLRRAPSAPLPSSGPARARPSARRACTGAELWRRLRHALTAPILPTGRGVNGAVWGHALDEHSSSRGSSLLVGVWGHRGFLPPGRGGSRTVGCVVVLVHSDSNKKPHRTRTPRDGGSSARPATSGERGRVAERHHQGHVLMSSATALPQPVHSERGLRRRRGCARASVRAGAGAGGQAGLGPPSHPGQGLTGLTVSAPVRRPNRLDRPPDK